MKSLRQQTNDFIKEVLVFWNKAEEEDGLWEKYDIDDFSFNDYCKEYDCEYIYEDILKKPELSDEVKQVFDEEHKEWINEVMAAEPYEVDMDDDSDNGI